MLAFPGADDRPAWEWQHFDLVHAQAKATLDADPRLPDFARAALLTTDEQPRIATGGVVVAGVIPSYARTGDAEAFAVTSWHFAMEPDRLVTCRRQATRALVNVWEAVRGKLALAGPAALICGATVGVMLLLLKWKRLL